MKPNTIVQSSEKIKTRLQQADEMSDVWEESDEVTRAYLKGCISTVAALTKKDTDEKEAGRG